MGNRAVIIAGSEIGKRHVVGIYVHWFSKQSAEDAVRECEANGCRSPDEDAPYGMARICESLCRRNPGGSNIGLVAVDLEEVRRDPRYGWLDVGYVAVLNGRLHRVVPADGDLALVPMDDD